MDNILSITKKYLPALYLTIFATIASYIFGKVIAKSEYNTSIWLVLFSIIFILFGRFIKYVKIKDIRKNQENPYEEIIIENKKEFYYSIRLFYVAALLTLVVYLIFYYILGYGQNALA